MSGSTRPSAASVLFLAHRVPYPPNRGDRIRSFHLLRHLGQQAAVDLAFLAHEPVDSATENVLQRLCRRVTWARLSPAARRARGLWSLAKGDSATEGAFDSPQLRRELREWTANTRYDAVLVFCSSMLQYLSVLPAGARPDVLVDLVDVDSQKWLDYAARSRGVPRWFFGLEGRRLRRLERSLPGRAKAILLVSEAEAALYRRVLDEDSATVGSPSAPRPTPVCAVSNGVDLDYFCPPAQQTVPQTLAAAPSPRPCSCVFVGALDYRANLDGLEWFCQNVWAEVHRRSPAARLAIVGSNPGPAARRLGERAGVDLVGAVPDVRPYLSAATAAVIPLRVARGVQNKVLEAMAMARPVVASPGALEGLDVQPGVHALQADSPSQWIEALIDVLSDPAKQRRLGAAGRAYVERFHNWDRCLEPLNELLGWGTGLGKPVLGGSPSEASSTGR